MTPDDAGTAEPVEPSSSASAGTDAPVAPEATETPAPTASAEPAPQPDAPAATATPAVVEGATLTDVRDELAGLRHDLGVAAYGGLVVALVLLLAVGIGLVRGFRR